MLKWQRSSTLLILLLCGDLLRASTLPMPFYNRDQNVYVMAPNEGFFVKKNVFVYRYHQNLCSPNLAEILEKKWDGILTSVEKRLNIFDPNLVSMSHKQGLIFAIGAFDFFNLFQGVFFSKTPHPGQGLITLDCRLFEDSTSKNPKDSKSELAVKAMLAHELVHFYYSRVNVPVWQEEMLAQYMEQKFSDSSKIKHAELQIQQQLPPLLDDSKPFKTLSSYSMNALFMQYLVDLFGERRVFEALKPLSLESSDPNVDVCRRSPSELDSILCVLQAHRWTIKDENNDGPQWLLKSAKSLLQTFAVALVLHLDPTSKDSKLFSITGWDGFQSPPLKKLPKILPATSFVRLNPKFLTSEIQKRQPILRILWNSQDFLILQGAEIEHPEKWQSVHVSSPDFDEVIYFNLEDGLQ